MNDKLFTRMNKGTFFINMELSQWNGRKQSTLSLRNLTNMELYQVVRHTGFDANEEHPGRK